MSNINPKLRFKEFTKPVKKVKFGDISKVNQGLQIPIAERFLQPVEGGQFYITNEFLKAGSNKCYYIQNPPASVICNEEDILMTRTGNTGQVVTDVSGAFHNNFFRIGFDRDKFYKSFLVQYLRTTKTQNHILKLAGTSTIPDLNHSDFYRIPIPYFEFDEQKKIADFLTSVDTKISQLAEKHRLLKEYKKGVMQQIFSQKIRFKDEDGKAFPEWTYESIGKYLEPHKELVRADTDIPILTSSRTGLYLQERSVINEGDYGVVPLGHFTYRHMSDDLIFKFNVNRTWEKGAVSKEYPVFKTVGMDTYFLEVQLNEGNDFKKFAIQQKQGGTRTRLYFKNLKELKLKLPCLKEQQKISQFLQSIDAKIEGVAEQIEQTKQFKKGLLQQMFV